MASLNNISTAAGPLSDTYAESLNPQRLALLKLSASSGFGLNDGRENFSEPTTPTGSKHRRALGSRASLAGGSALARSTRQVSTMSSRRTASFMQSHRHKMSLELTAQAEKRFLTLMELMANASKEASSLKEYWTRLMVDRESEDREKEQLLVQIDEITQSLEERDNQQDTHKREATNRKKEVEKLLIELSAALATVDEHKKKVFERDAELERAHSETAEIRATLSRTHVEHEQLRSNYESVQAKLRVAESELTQSKDEVERFRSDFRSLTREHSELKSRNADLTASLEAARKEIIPLTERIRGWELEKTGILYEKDKVESQFRKQTLKTDELQRELTDLTERYERLQRENTRSRELVTKTELERDEQQGAAERFRHEVKDATTRLEEVEGQREETLLQLEQSRRHAASIEERIIEKDSTISRLQQQFDERQEGYRLIVIERDQLRDDLEGEHKSAHTSRQKIISLEEQLLQAEHKLTELRSESHTVTERIRVIEGERDDARNKHARVSSEIEALSARIVILQGEVRAANEARDHKHAEVDHYKQKYEEVTETIEEWNNDSSELEIEIENLRVMLREAREQKEKAISGRNTADRERDEYISLYEEKCRELERLEESSARASSYFSSSAHGHSGARSSSYRVVSRKSGGTSSGVHNGHTEEHTHTTDAV